MPRAKRRVASVLAPMEEAEGAGGPLALLGGEPPVAGWNGFTKEQREFLLLRSRLDTNWECFDRMERFHKPEIKNPHGSGDGWLYMTSIGGNPYFAEIFYKLTKGSEEEAQAARVAIERASTLDIAPLMVRRLGRIIEGGSDREALGAMNLFVRLLGGMESVPAYKPNEKEKDESPMPFTVRRVTDVEGNTAEEIKVG